MSRSFTVKEEVAFALREVLEREWPSFKRSTELEVYRRLAERLVNVLERSNVEVLPTRQLADELIVAMSRGPRVLDEEGEDECPDLH